MPLMDKIGQEHDDLVTINFGPVHLHKLQHKRRQRLERQDRITCALFETIPKLEECLLRTSHVCVLIDFLQSMSTVLLECDCLLPFQ